ncbi:MAG: DsrE family protein [bacterium]|nr:DsrE family protein [bacterium]
MAKYLLIESRDPFDSNDISFSYDLVTGLKQEGHEVTLFLVQNGVFPARPSVKSKSLTETAKAGVEVLADDFSLRERGIPTDRLAQGVKAAPLDTVIDHMAEGSKVIWH